MLIRIWASGLVAAALLAGVLPSGSIASPGVGQSLQTKCNDLDKTWTNARSQNSGSSQSVDFQHVASFSNSQAQGKGLEPSTPCGATDFESVS